ncbi:Crp/Fnr family transcriptional regulator [Amycolatopsis sp. QT-25]|uniref:Crp/Fnr family transcriptional regulator n=1 Tax=Amycolatopsis sp. QT-25 TaxID=3034022 RepID=UPI0023ED64B4|nr:Crp/Fnr family transcriptional regulator [Amycolatopsis sp. QT-25]WET82311.1 Crp/Fnr family transcriptional regulator [Amycolatopsis sp. QT-25]
MSDLGALPVVPLFAGLDAERLRRIADRSSVEVVEADRVVAVRGEPATRLIVVESGTVTAARETADGRRLRLGEFPAPCAVDKVAVLDAGAHTATWSAATRARLRFVPAREFLAIVDDVPRVRRHVLARLARDVRELQDELVRASFADVATRVAAWLTRAAGRSGTTVVLPGAQHGLAEAIGATRVSVNRALRALAAEGLISVGPGFVKVLAPELLARRAL